jgi:hypothetical protein
MTLMPPERTGTTVSGDEQRTGMAFRGRLGREDDVCGRWGVGQVEGR